MALPSEIHRVFGIQCDLDEARSGMQCLLTPLFGRLDESSRSGVLRWLRLQWLARSNSTARNSAFKLCSVLTAGLQLQEFQGDFWVVHVYALKNWVSGLTQKAC